MPGRSGLAMVEEEVVEISMELQLLVKDRGLIEGHFWGVYHGVCMGKKTSHS